ncbi:MAG TPA: FAD/NAD(P)-binding oxidoreductase [Pseudomonas sp.]|nr:FAD/NAD(P)-binding oxidoreductase [Pseudomonas sp.]
MNRRDFFRLASLAGVGATASTWLGLANAATAPQLGTVPTNTGIRGRVVVIGGGMGGATVAKYLRLWGGTGVSVTLVERDAAYTSNILSNLVLNGQRTITSLQYGYSNLATRYGIRIVKGDVTAIDPVGHSVLLADGTKLPYDRLVIAPGVDFDIYPGLETAAAQAKVPHAWRAGVQTTQLRNMLVNMKAGETFVMSIPAKPYRCPPGPYERACVVADWLKKNRAGSKVIVLDANPGITAEPHAFANAFDVVHKGVVEYHPGVSISSIDASNMTLNTSLGNLKAKVINAIPPHKAGKVVINNGLANVGGRWAGVDVLTYQSTAAPGIHVIGDASATTQPKAGHIANQEAKTCADAIVRLLAGRSPDPSPITNSACYSPITADTASWLTAVFAYDPVSGTMQPVPGSAGEAAGRSQDNYKEMFKWFNTLMEDSFA